MHIKFYLKIFFITIFLSGSFVYALGIGATESKVCIFADDGGEMTYEKLRLVNPNEVPRNISIVKKRSEGDGSFLPLPNLDWVEINPQAVVVPANSKSEPIKITISVPDSDIYLNKRFVFDLIVQPGNTGAFVAGLVIPVYITTVPSRKIPRFCDGCGLSIYPNVLKIENGIDSICIVNWSSDTARLEIGWNRPGQKGWQDALMIMQRVMTAYIPIDKEFIIEPNGKKKIFIKPLAFPGRGKLYFSGKNGLKDFLNIEWGNFDR